MAGKGSLDFYFVRLCSGRSAFEALPKKSVRFDKTQLAEKLREKGYLTEDYGSLLIAKKEFEVTIFPSGRLLMKTNEDAKARAEAQTIGNLILEIVSNAIVF